MPSLSKKHSFHGDINEVFAAISTYSKYPDYLPGVQKIEVLPAKSKGSSCQVKYEIHFIKTFYYTLDMFADEPKKIWWEMADSNLMKKNSGSWDFVEAEDETVDATYTLDVEFKGFVPKSITDTIAKANLPLMFEGFQKLINDYDG